LVLPLPGAQHWNRSIIGMQLGAGNDVAADCLDQLIEQGAAGTHSSGAQGSVPIHALGHG
jgi:hypothetical protein